MARAGLVVALGLLASCTGCAGSPVGEGNPAAPSSQGLGRLRPTDSMITARAVHTATTLADGSVLVAGGCTAPGCEVGSPEGATAEIYDPQGSHFSPTERMGVSRDDHTATLLRDGRVLLAGGWGAGGVLESTELYDPATEAFSTGPRMRSRRAGFTATLLRDGRVLLAGGFVDNDRTVPDAEIFDPGSGLMTPAEPMTVPRGGHSAALLADGRVLITGGLSDGQVTGAAELFDPRSGRFSSTGSLSTPRYKTATVALRNGTALVIGGSGDVEGARLFDTTERFDPRTGRFVRGPRMHLARYKLAGSVVRLPTGDVLVAGGAGQAEIYDAATRRFHLVSGSVNGDRLFLAASRLSGDRALVTGGYDAGITPTARAWIYR